MMNRKIIALCVLCAVSAGCATPHQVLIEHPKKGVRYPAKAGEAVGEILGFPVAVIFLPVSLIVGACSDDPETAAWAPLYPWIVTRDTTTTLFGGGPWLLFGWWGVPKSTQAPKSTSDISVHPRRGTYIETEAGGMVVGETSTNKIDRATEEK